MVDAGLLVLDAGLVLVTGLVVVGGGACEVVDDAGLVDVTSVVGLDELTGLVPEDPPPVNV